MIIYASILSHLGHNKDKVMAMVSLMRNKEGRPITIKTLDKDLVSKVSDKGLEIIHLAISTNNKRSNAKDMNK